jgi:CRISPR-associated protein Cmr2
MQHLIIVSIGPVQEFIASARRSRDLWFGSWLLSELSKAAAKTIADRYGLEGLIFPAPAEKQALEPETNFNVANKVVALVDIESNEVAAVGRSINHAVRDRLQSIWEDVRGRVPGWKHLHQDTANAQVDDLVECSWVAVPVRHSEEYNQARMRAEAALAARKATRDFKQVTWGSSVPKSSLDGQRESVIPESAYSQQNDAVEERKYKIDRLYADFGAGQAERLSGIDLLKRHGSREHAAEPRFFSTSHVAALSLLPRLTSQDRPRVERYISDLKQFGVSQEALTKVPGVVHPAFANYDGHLLFEERLNEFFVDDTERLKAKRALQTFIKEVVGGRYPQPYYALLLADGDRMGATINHQGTAEKHRRLSQQLARFADEARQIVERNNFGSLVYAGGDDVLAFVPLHTVLGCAWQLADTFGEILNGFTEEHGKSPTLSVGIAVAHHVEPLSDALTLVREAEKKAKSVPNKNALAVVVSKRSGVDRKVSDAREKLAERLMLFIRLHRLEAIPDGAAYELRNLARQLNVPKSHNDYALMQDAMREDAIRILRRKRVMGGKMELAEETLGHLEPFIRNKDLPLEHLADELIISQLLPMLSTWQICRLILRRRPMQTLIIEPRDPLIVRDGRPFGPTPGARAMSLSFPFPSTTTGGVRTRAGLNDAGIFDALPDDVKMIGVRGPLLVELSDKGEIDEWLVPAPADALLFGVNTTDQVNTEEQESQRKQQVEVKQLMPLERDETFQTDLDSNLSLVGLPKADQRKPFGQAPRFWYWKQFEQWLLNPSDRSTTLTRLGRICKPWRVPCSIAPYVSRRFNERTMGAA